MLAIVKLSNRFQQNDGHILPATPPTLFIYFMPHGDNPHLPPAYLSLYIYS